jgi:PAS domain S-box-containing protein
MSKQHALRKNLQQSSSLAELRAQAEALFTSIGDGAIATDEFGKITRINPVALSILGFKESDLLGEWFPKVIVAVNEDDSPVSLIDRPIAKIFLTGKPIFEKMYYRRKNGTKVAVSITASPILLNKKPIGAIEVFRDITLEYEVDRMKSEFISLASHQLRTPLSSVKTYAHMLVDGYLGEVSPGQRSALKTIISAANRMNELISMLLNITRIESGSITVTAKPLSAGKLVEDVVKELQMQANDKNIILRLQEPARTAIVKTDSLLAKEILSNLISNAIKYTPEEGSIDVQVHNRKGNVVFSVRDTGLGIPKFSQDQIFTKFFRAPNVVRRETTGTGLGLYLVKGLSDRLGGQVWFESTEGKGTTFYCSLPKYTPLISRARKTTKP